MDSLPTEPLKEYIFLNNISYMSYAKLDSFFLNFVLFLNFTNCISFVLINLSHLISIAVLHGRYDDMDDTH